MPRFDGQVRFLAGLIHLMQDRPACGVISGVRGDQRRDRQRRRRLGGVISGAG
jgi:hypothetical protein